MAVDTAAKRFSMMNFGTWGPSRILFEVDGSVDLDDRTHMLHLYGGIALGAPPILFDIQADLEIGPATVTASALEIGPATVTASALEIGPATVTASLEVF